MTPHPYSPAAYKRRARASGAVRIGKLLGVVMMAGVMVVVLFYAMGGG